MEIEKITPGGICHITMKGKPTFKKGFVDETKIKLAPNTIYMMNAYQTEWPYALKFLTIFCDENGELHMTNYNPFVGPDAPSKERTNYVYQDTTPLITPAEWWSIVQEFIKDKPDARLHMLKPDLGDAMMSFNNAWQIFRKLEIATDEEVASGNLTNLRPPKDNNWDWKKWGERKFDEIRTRFSVKQGELIRAGLKHNLKKHGVSIDMSQLTVLVGRIDGRYAGVISYNICYPDKYSNFEKDMKRFEHDNRYEWLFAILCAILFAFKPQYVVMLMPLMLMLSMSGNREYVRLEAGDEPHLFDISKPFLVAPESFEDGFFNAEAEDFKEFIFSGKCLGKELRAIVIGANENGEMYSSLLCH